MNQAPVTNEVQVLMMATRMKSLVTRMNPLASSQDIHPTEVLIPGIALIQILRLVLPSTLMLGAHIQRLIEYGVVGTEITPKSHMTCYIRRRGTRKGENQMTGLRLNVIPVSYTHLTLPTKRIV